MGFKMKKFSGFGKGTTPFKAKGDKTKKSKKKKDEFGNVEKDQYPNLVEDQSVVQKHKDGRLYTTGKGKEGNIHSIGPHFESDTTFYPRGFSDYRGEVKEGDYLDETTHDAWGGVDVEDHSNPYEGQKATGVRKVWDPKKKKYVDYKKKK